MFMYRKSQLLCVYSYLYLSLRSLVSVYLWQESLRALQTRRQSDGQTYNRQNVPWKWNLKKTSMQKTMIKLIRNQSKVKVKGTWKKKPKLKTFFFRSLNITIASKRISLSKLAYSLFHFQNFLSLSKCVCGLRQESTWPCNLTILWTRARERRAECR